MPEFSAEFWAATAIAAIALLVGLAVTLAMDAKTRGEFRVAAGCFLLTAAITVYGIGVLEMSAMWPARLRVPVAWALFATVAVLTCEAIRWAHARHLRTATEHDVPTNPPPQGGGPGPSIAQGTATLEVKPAPPRNSRQPRVTNDLLPQIARDVGEIKKNVVPFQRHLSDEDRTKLASLLRAGGQFEVAVRHNQGSMESQTYADDFVAALKDAGWSKPQAKVSDTRARHSRLVDYGA